MEVVDRAISSTTAPTKAFSRYSESGSSYGIDSAYNYIFQYTLAISHKENKLDHLLFISDISYPLLNTFQESGPLIDS